MIFISADVGTEGNHFFFQKVFISYVHSRRTNTGVIGNEFFYSLFFFLFCTYSLSRGEEKWMIGRKGDRWRESYSHAYRGYPVRVKVRKIYDKYGMFFILIYGVAKRLCTVMHSSCVCLGWTGGKKVLIYRERRKNRLFFIHMM